MLAYMTSSNRVSHAGSPADLAAWQRHALTPTLATLGLFSPLFLCMAVPVAGGGVQELLRGFLGQQESTIMVSSTALASSIMHRAHVNA
jgi:hypothetical protein